PTPSPLHLNSFPTRRSSDLAEMNASDRVPAVIPTTALTRIATPHGAAKRDRRGCRGQRETGQPSRRLRGFGRRTRSRRSFQPAKDRKSTRLNSSHEWISYAV